MSKSTAGERLIEFFTDVVEDEKKWLRLRTEPRQVVEESKILKPKEKKWLLADDFEAINEAIAGSDKKILAPVTFKILRSGNPPKILRSEQSPKILYSKK